MNVLNDERIRELIAYRSPHCVSIFLPTHRACREQQQQDTIRLKNLIGEAKQRMVDETDSSVTADQVLRPLRELRANEIFWQNRSDGLACFCASEFFRAYRVPIKIDEQLFLNERFHIRPLLPILSSDARLYVLALTQETARLFEATRYSMREIELPEVYQRQVDGSEPALQYHSHNAPTQGRGSTEAAIYHGQGGPSERAKKDALSFFQSVDRAVTGVLRGQRSPLVLACVGYLAPIYESANRYKHLISGKVPGSPDRWTEDELRQHAWKLVEPRFRQSQQKAWEELQQASIQGRASDKLRSVVLAADQGRVDTLFLARGQQRWGHIDPKLQAVHPVEREQEGEELLDFAAVRTLSNGGEVYLLDSLPNTDAPAAASFRY